MRWCCRQQTLIVLLIFIDRVETSKRSLDLHVDALLAWQSSSSVPEEFLFCIRLQPKPHGHFYTGRKFSSAAYRTHELLWQFSLQSYTPAHHRLLPSSPGFPLTSPPIRPKLSILRGWKEEKKEQSVHPSPILSRSLSSCCSLSAVKKFGHTIPSTDRCVPINLYQIVSRSKGDF